MPSLYEIGQVVLEKKIFLNFVNVYLLFRNYLPFEMGMALHLNKFKSPLHKDALCQVWLKLAHCSCSGEDFLKFRQCILLFLNYLPLERAGSSFADT